MFNKSRPDTTSELEVTPSLVDKQSDDLEVTMVTTQEVSQQAIESLSEVLEALPEIEKKEHSEDSVVSKRRQPRRVKPVPVDLELLKTVAGRFGIEIRSGKGQGYDHALSELLLLLKQNAIASGEPPQPIEPAAPVSQTVADQAKTLAWLTGRVEALEAEISQLQQEKQGAIETSLSMENEEQSQLEVKQLHDENNRLKTELLQTQSRLEGIQRFLNGGAIAMTTQEKKATTAIEKTTPADGIKTQAVSPTASPIPQKAPDAVSQADLDPDVLRALQAILDYNEYEATSHQQRWAISIPVMKDLLKQLGKATQPKIEAVLRAKSETIEEHHRHHGLGQRHNRVHQGRSISDVIKL